MCFEECTEYCDLLLKEVLSQFSKCAAVPFMFIFSLVFQETLITTVDSNSRYVVVFP